MVHVVAYQPVRGIPLEEYLDFKIGSKFPDEEITAMAENGTMPPGLVLQMKDGWPCVVVGKYGSHQKVERLVVKNVG
ncbi:MAG: hypothetical protein CVU42_13785 [Chloroflexi bacterium HGW-Chloroflexi-4]|jgi:hypothetical protein|nr:MAG: hypothetical protein CVU42_13785 [Chloroflexi bacterium HGW-Chloroflexi-4]